MMQCDQTRRVLIQGLDGDRGLYYAQALQAYGTQVVGGIAAGQSPPFPGGIPVFDLVEQAIAEVGPVDISVIFDSPQKVLDACEEAIAAGIRQLIVTTPQVPSLDRWRLRSLAQTTGTLILGPHSGGFIRPGELWVGTGDPHSYQPGSVAIVSRFQSLSQEMALALHQAGMGVAWSVHLGHGGILSSDFVSWLAWAQSDERVSHVVLIGYGHTAPERAAAQYLQDHPHKPAIAYLVGLTPQNQPLYSDARTLLLYKLSSQPPQDLDLTPWHQAHIPLVDHPAEAIAQILHPRIEHPKPRSRRPAKSWKKSPP